MSPIPIHEFHLRHWAGILLLAVFFWSPTAFTDSEYGDDGLKTTGDINLDNFAYDTKEDFFGGSHVNPATGELLYRRTLFEVPGRSGFKLKVDLNYVSSVSQKGISKRDVHVGTGYAIDPEYGSVKRDDLIYSNSGPQWIISVNNIAVQVLNFETSAYHLAPGNSQLSSGDNFCNLVIGYHWSNTASINIYNNEPIDTPRNQFITFLKGDGSLYKMVDDSFYSPFSSHYEFTSNAKGEPTKPVGFTFGDMGSRIFALKPGDGTTILYQEDILNFEAGLENCGAAFPCDNPLLLPRTFYATELADRFNNKLTFEYEDNPEGYGRKNLTRILMDFDPSTTNDDYIVELNYTRDAGQITEIAITDPQQTFGLHALTSAEYDSAKDKFMVDRITWQGGNDIMADTEIEYDFSVHQFRANPVQCSSDSSQDGAVLYRMLKDDNDVVINQRIPCTFIYEHPGISKITYPSGKEERFYYHNEKSSLGAPYQEDCTLPEMQNGTCHNCSSADLCLNEYTIGRDDFYIQGVGGVLRYPIQQNQTFNLGLMGHEQFHRRLVRERVVMGPHPDDYSTRYDYFDYEVLYNPTSAEGTNYHKLEKRTTVRTIDYLNYLEQSDAPTKTVSYTYKTMALRPDSNISYHTFLTDKPCLQIGGSDEVAAFIFKGHLPVF